MSVSSLTRFMLLLELKLLNFFQRGSTRLYYQTVKHSPFEICPKCASPSSKVHDKRVVQIKDAPVVGKHKYLQIVKRRFRCPRCKSVFTEPIQRIKKYARITQRFEKSILWSCETFSDLKRVRTVHACSYKLIYKCFIGS